MCIVMKKLVPEVRWDCG